METRIALSSRKDTTNETLVDEEQQHQMWKLKEPWKLHLRFQTNLPILWQVWTRGKYLPQQIMIHILGLTPITTEVEISSPATTALNQSPNHCSHGHSRHVKRSSLVYQKWS